MTGYLQDIYSSDPSATAVEHGYERLVYGDLMQQADRLACGLIARGIKPGDRVGIALEKGVELGIALLGTLRAGAAYVPFDLRYPAERLRMMLDIAQPRLLVSNSTELWGSGSPVPSVCPKQLVASGGRALSLPMRTPEAVAYVVFTSGSTGQPKAVAMPDRALNNLLDWQSTVAGFDAPARVAQLTPVSFDVHFQEYFHTWSEGGTLVVVEDGAQRDPQSLLATLRSERVERLYLPYVGLSQLAEAASTGSVYPDRLRDVVTAGEQLVITRAIRGFFEALPECRLHNQYGPSETHVVTAHTLGANAAGWVDVPPIGRAVANCWVQIVDSELAPLAAGEPGELLAGGDCLSAGYLDDPVLTAARFVETRWGRAYRTGDLALCDAEGNLVYLGRADQQVKVRGYRVEPGEVEAAILQDPEVANCAVVPWGDSSETRQLVAHIVLEDQSAMDPSIEGAELQQWREVWDGTYSLSTGQDPRFDLRGWNSSYTGKPLATEQMSEWVSQTARWIAASGGKSILELGCGTGLIMFALEGRFERYRATDFSPLTVAQLKRSVAGYPDLRSKVEVSELAAHQAGQLDPGVFDTVVINSLTQHFVGVEYLLRVVKASVSALGGNGQVFLGDITSRTTRRLYFASVELARQGPNTIAAELLDEITKRAGEERELVIDPWFFHRLPELVPEISDVEVRLKRGNYLNELSQFRYDVKLVIGGTARRPTLMCQRIEVEAAADVQSLEAILERLHRHFRDPANEAALYLKNLPNKRVYGLARLVEALDAQPRAQVAALVEQHEQNFPSLPGIDPDRLLEAVDDLGFGKSELLFAAEPGCMDLIVEPVTVQTAGEISPLARLHRHRTLASYANRPLNQTRFNTVARRLREALPQRLPEYMVPSRLVPLAVLPLTPSGKIDRRRLPTPTSTRPELITPYVPPRTSTEERLCAIWQRELELDVVGIDDNFFDLGGNSISSLKLAGRMSSELQQTIPIVVLFQNPTIAVLAAHLDVPAQGVAQHSQAERRSQRVAGQQRAVAANLRRLRNRKV